VFIAKPRRLRYSAWCQPASNTTFCFTAAARGDSSVLSFHCEPVKGFSSGNYLNTMTHCVLKLTGIIIIVIVIIMIIIQFCWKTEQFCWFLSFIVVVVAVVVLLF